MPRSRSLASVILAGLPLAVACGGGPSGAGPVPDAPLPGRVVIVSIDGMRPDALTAARTPNLAALIQRGASTLQGRTVVPPITLPSHTSMLTGYLPAQHGVTWNDYIPGRGGPRVPTVFAQARRAGRRTVALVGKEKFKHLDVDGTIDVFATGDHDPDVAALAIAHARSFDLMFVHLPDTDRSGHSRGWMSAAYLQALAAADEQLGRVLGALPPQTTVIVTADHGGEGTGHGSDKPADMTIPWIVVGPDVVPGHQLLGPVSTTDTAATALFLLRLSLPADAPGRPVLEAFRTVADGCTGGSLRGVAPQCRGRDSRAAA